MAGREPIQMGCMNARADVAIQAAEKIETLQKIFSEAFLKH